MRKTLQQTLDESLDRAVEAHFVNLFSVLMHDASDAGFGRFMKGFNKLTRMYYELLPVIEDIETPED